jgi:hypothetical protein
MEKIENDSVKYLEGVMPRPATTRQVRIERAPRGNEAENMRQQASSLVGQQTERARFGRGKFDQRIERISFRPICSLVSLLACQE